MKEIVYQGVTFKEPIRPEGRIGKYHQRTHSALKGNKMQKKPCEICGNVKSEAHHEVYSDSDVVRWLCRKHHKIVHFLFLPRKQKSENSVKIQFGIPMQFSIQLDRYIIDLKEAGIKPIPTKAELIMKFAEETFNKLDLES